MDEITENLSKKERRRLQKELKQQKEAKEARKGRFLNIAFVAGAIILILGGIFLFQFFKQKEAVNSGTIQLTPQTYDFGKVSLAGGKVQTSFEVKNIGQDDLVISGVQTSCDCTSAKIKIGDQESPIFSMHPSLKTWSGRLKPGEGGELIVIYDPQVHPVSGPVNRLVEVSSNDPRGKQKVMIYAEVEP